MFLFARRAFVDFRWNDETLHFTRRAAKVLISVSTTFLLNYLSSLCIKLPTRKGNLSSRVSLLLTHSSQKVKLRRFALVVSAAFLRARRHYALKNKRIASRACRRQTPTRVDFSFESERASCVTDGSGVRKEGAIIVFSERARERHGKQLSRS